MINLPCPSCGSLLEIPSGIDHLGCASCGATLDTLRKGNIIALELVKTDTQNLKARIKHLEQELDRVSHEKMIDAPAYALLRHDFLGMRKLFVWSVTFASEDHLESLFLNLTLDELGMLIKKYSSQPNSKIKLWLERVHHLREEINQLRVELAQQSQ